MQRKIAKLIFFFVLLHICTSHALATKSPPKDLPVLATASTSYGFAPLSIDIAPNGNGYSVQLTVGSSTSWTASTNLSWINITTVSGTGPQVIFFTASPNNDPVASRTGKIKVECSNGSVYYLSLSQKRYTVWPVLTYNNATGVQVTQEPSSLPSEAIPSKGYVITGIGDVTSFYGTRYTSSNSLNKYHWAIDIDVGSSTTIKARAAMSGTVKKVGYSTTTGNYVEIEHTIAGVTFKTRYLHLQSYCVSKDSIVNAGTQIGIVGGTGSANGDLHLHFELLKKYGDKYYMINTVPYYHGSDDRGTTQSLYNSNNQQLIVHANNPFFVINTSGKWIANLNCAHLYPSLTSNSSFTSNFLHAKRNNAIIEEAVK